MTPPARSGRTLLVLAIGALAFSLAQTTVIPAIPELMKGLHTDENGVTCGARVGGAGRDRGLVAPGRAGPGPRGVLTDLATG